MKSLVNPSGLIVALSVVSIVNRLEKYDVMAYLMSTREVCSLSLYLI